MTDQKLIGAQLGEALAQLAKKDEVRTIVREVNAHTDKVHGELREDLREQGIRVRSLGSRAG